MRRRSELEHMMGAACANPNKASQFTSRATARRRTRGCQEGCTVWSVESCGSSVVDVEENIRHKYSSLIPSYWADLNLSRYLVAVHWWTHEYISLILAII